MDAQELRQLYDKVTTFLHSCGGLYENPPERTYLRLLECLDKGLYYLKEEDGEITCFCNYWLIHDLDAVRRGEQPEDITTGPIVYVVDHANRGNIREMIAHLRTIESKGTAWWHKGERFIHFPNQKGASYGRRS